MIFINEEPFCPLVVAIYPIETLKTQMMSTTGETKRDVISAARRVWALGGMRAYYRGLTVGLVGVFPWVLCHITLAMAVLSRI